MADLLTFLDLQNRVLRWIDESTDEATTLALVKDAVNASQRRLLGKRPWPFMRWPKIESILTVAGIKAYALKPEMGKLLTLWDTVERQYVPIIPLRAFPELGVDLTETNVRPYGAVYGAHWPVSEQPVTASAIIVVSSSASDTAGPTVILEGLDANGDLQTETLTLTGTTPVTGSTAFLYLTNVTKTGSWVGTLTVKYGVITLLTLAAGKYGKTYPTIEFTEYPAGNELFTYTFERVPRTMVNDYDIPHTPYPFSEIHVYDALLDLTTYNTELGLKEQRMWQSRYDEFMEALEEAVDSQVTGSSPRMVRDLVAPSTRSLIIQSA